MFDCILSNPPYIETHQISLLDDELFYEPRAALDGGDDGLDFYRHIAKEYKAYLKDGGILAFEVGYNQATAVCKIMEQNGFKNIQTRKDYCDVDRVVFGTAN